MTAREVDLFVIGGGSGGVRAARRAAERGASVAIAEQHRFGGTCVIRGCVPKKLLVYASGFSETARAGAGFGWKFPPPEFDWSTLIGNVHQEVARLEGIYRRNLERAGVSIIDDRAVLTAPDEIRLAAGGTVQAKTILLATGGWPLVPDVQGRDLAGTSNDVFELERLPQRVAVVGGGYIASEFAAVFQGLGSQVTQLYRGPLFMRGFDDDLRAYAASGLRGHGVDLRFNTDVERVSEVKGEARRVDLRGGESVEADFVLYATGRAPAADGLGLEEAGVRRDGQGRVEVDDYGQTSQANVYAVGDVCNRVNQTPVAIREAEAFVRTVYGGTPTRADLAVVPLAVFTRPELATAGMTEAQAREHAEGEVAVQKSQFKPLFEALGGIGEEAFIKVVSERESGRVLGAHLGGHAAAEMMQCLAVALRMGATRDDLARTLALHPTVAEELVTLPPPA